MTWVRCSTRRWPHRRSPARAPALTRRTTASWRGLVVTEVSAEQLLEWVDGYQRAWRTAGTDGLRDLFTDDAEYLASPYDTPLVGLVAIREMWDEDRNGPDEVFTMTADVVAC